MELEELQEPALHGLIGAVISVIITYGVHMAIPSGDLLWALYAVAFSAFFSAGFAVYFSKQE